MADEGRLKRIRERVAARRAAGRGSEELDPARDATDPADPPADLETGTESRSEFELGDLGETRLQSLRRRVSGIGGGVAGSGRLAELRERAGEAAGVLGRHLREVGGRLRGIWFAVPLGVRQRIAAITALLAIVALVLFVLVPLAPCWAPGGDRCPPDDDAISLVPADSSAYLHANLDAETDQFEVTSALSDRLPLVTEIVIGSLPGLSFDQIAYDRDIRPWSGGEVAVVLEPRGRSLERLLMLEVEDRDPALEFGSRLLGRGIRDVQIDGTAAKVDGEGLAVALVGGFLLVGEEQRVAESIALAAGEGESLEQNPAAETARSRLPESRVADAFLSGPLVRRLRTDPRLASFDTFVDAASSDGAAVSVSGGEGDLSVAVRSVLDPDAVADDADLISALEPFDPTLAEEISADALVYLGVGDPAASAATLIGRAAETSPELFSGLERFTRRLRRRDGINVERRILPLLAGEAALTVEPQAVGGTEGDATAALRAPYLALLATEVGEGAAAELAELQGPIAASVDPSGGQAPVFETRDIAGIEVQSLRISPVVDLTYASFGDRLLVATSPAAIERARSGAEALADTDRFRDLTDDLPDASSLFLYLDVEGLLALGEALFLSEDPDYATLAPDLRTLEAAVLAVRRAETALDTDLRLGVGQPDPLPEGVPTLPAP